MINAYQVGLLYKHGTYQHMMKEGTHWQWPSQRIEVYDLTVPFAPACELNILLKDEALAEALTPGRDAYWKGIVVYGFVHLDLGKIEITENLDRATLLHKLVSPYVRAYTVESYEKALLFVDGKYVQTLESGVYYWWKNSIAIHVGKVDTRQLQLEINGQEILTRNQVLMEDNPMLFKLKEMEYVEKIAEKVSSISVNGNGVLIDQLRQIFTAAK